MNGVTKYGVAALCVSLLPMLAWAGDAFDGKTNLICTVQQLHECDSFAGCQALDAGIATPLRHLAVSFSDHKVQLYGLSADLASEIGSVASIEGKLIVQGTDAGLTDEADDGGGWTIAISQAYGSMLFTVTGHDVAFVGMGNCVSAP